jgi:hypothetical protein
MKYFLTHKDLCRWCAEKSVELETDEPVHDLASAEALIERCVKLNVLGWHPWVGVYLDMNELPFGKAWVRAG